MNNLSNEEVAMILQVLVNIAHQSGRNPDVYEVGAMDAQTRAEEEWVITVEKRENRGLQYLMPIGGIQ